MGRAPATLVVPVLVLCLQACGSGSQHGDAGTDPGIDIVDDLTGDPDAVVDPRTDPDADPDSAMDPDAAADPLEDPGAEDADDEDGPWGCIGAHTVTVPGTYEGDSSDDSLDYMLDPLAECWVGTWDQTDARDEVWTVHLPARAALAVSVFSAVFGRDCQVALYAVSDCAPDPAAIYCGSTASICMGDLTCLVADGNTLTPVITYTNSTDSIMTLHVIVDSHGMCCGPYYIEFDWS
jgi:hypothetical protein